MKIRDILQNSWSVHVEIAKAIKNNVLESDTVWMSLRKPKDLIFCHNWNEILEYKKDIQ